ncbi:Ycf51 family protein [Planktothrix pseudagardhii]|uniref:Ycf51-like protein n=1 Tax=Planktothrix pseudagardhii TaxID=132604 RepID=A0A9W4CZI0_9CYAN|nr:Ycf51 family protein [Planktothrix pseudagardhii]CAD5923529.1 Ycf51-like protein [Planktothrix pseudagardhii]
MNFPLSTTDWLELSKWVGIATLAFAGITALAFIFKWGIRFRLVGITAFTGVLTVGVFGLSLGLFYHVEIPGALPYTRVFDDGGRQIVIAVPPNITETQLNATLRQAAANLYSPGRGGQFQEALLIRARTLVHPNAEVSQPLYLGQVKRSVIERENDNLEIQIFTKNLARLQQFNS